MIDFSKKERVILIFLCTAFIAGASIKIVKRRGQKNYYSDLETNIVLSDSSFKNALQKTYSDSSDDLIELKININTAVKNELEKLPGIGPVIASRIIEYREKNNGFKNVAELKNIRGIGEKKFKQLSLNIYVKQ